MRGIKADRKCGFNTYDHPTRASRSKVGTEEFEEAEIAAVTPDQGADVRANHVAHDHAANQEAADRSRVFATRIPTLFNTSHGHQFFHVRHYKSPSQLFWRKLFLQAIVFQNSKLNFEDAVNNK
ncbi:hypothetical protein KIN20_031951 [Parelaphostrongylus tenuis]|uniref:Uncharacterized protein n=1 Tax=Parelaphostrongylus tenuis TaxID=148309 RepID=A0AAD5R663_PARTN|nr:hypothetical protein KIN20_031951 [Parelaphostrongylus tenuis]